VAFFWERRQRFSSGGDLKKEAQWGKKAMDGNQKVKTKEIKEEKEQ